MRVRGYPHYLTVANRVLQKPRALQTFRRILRVSRSRIFSGDVRLAFSESRFFARLRVSKSRFVRLSAFSNDVFSSLHDIEFQWSNLQISKKKLILTSPKLFEFHKKLQNLPQRPFWRQKNSYFTLGYHNAVCYNRISGSSQFQEAGLRLYKLILALN